MLSMWVYDGEPERPARRAKDRLAEPAREVIRRASDPLASEDGITVTGAACPAAAS